ncbi:MAG: FG-GAP repeat protein, partial [Syntrophobacteraceae bacterium]
MKKSCIGVLTGLFLFSGLFFAIRASAVSSAGGNRGKSYGVGTVKGARSTRTDISSLPGGLQRAVSETFGANDPQYRVTGSNGAYRAVNSRERLRASIGMEGFTVRKGSNEWGLRMTAWGRGSRLTKAGPGKALSNSNRVEINRGGIVEWWVNGPLGIEQGWTIAKRPHEGPDRGRLRLVLSESGNLRATVLPRGKSLSVSSSTGREVLRYAGLSAYDKTGRRLPAHFEATAKEVCVVVDDRNAAYPVRIDPWIQTAELTASGDAPYDSLGWSVAVSADGKTVVAGAPEATVGANSCQGAVYVFKEPASGWANGTQAARLTASDGAADDQLGHSVAMSADGATVIAGAECAAVGGNKDQGAVYLFKEPASGWANGTESAKLTASDMGLGGGQLGDSVAVSANGATVVATGWDASDQYSVYVFGEPASGWASMTQTAKLSESGGGVGDDGTVAISSDGATVVAGDVRYEGFEGAVYVFKKPGSGWANETETAELTASDGAEDDLGYSVAVSADGSTVAAGATFATVGG